MNRLWGILLVFAIVSCSNNEGNQVITVNGPVPSSQMGLTLPHEHVLVDFIGAEQSEPARYDRDTAYEVILPHIRELVRYGVKTFVECTPKYLGRDVLLLRQLADATGIQFITNTGFYGARGNLFIPRHVLTMSAPAIATFWIAEFNQGIEGTGIRPGFIKIGVDRGELSEFHATLAKAAAIAHRETGLTIMSHTGPAIGALQQLEILKQEGVAPDAFIWTHAHNEKELSRHIEIAKMGAWVALDGFRARKEQTTEFVSMIINLKRNNCLNRLLLSHDAGWFDPDKPEGENFQPYTFLFEELVPALNQAGITDADLHQVLEVNPGKAFTVKRRLLD